MLIFAIKMDKDTIKRHLADLRLLTVFPRRYEQPKGKPLDWWTDVARRYGNEQKAVTDSGCNWRVLEYEDGHRELTYLRVLKGGMFSGKYPALYRGLLVPRRVDYATFARIKRIRIAF